MAAAATAETAVEQLQTAEVAAAAPADHPALELDTAAFFLMEALVERTKVTATAQDQAKLELEEAAAAAAEVTALMVVKVALALASFSIRKLVVTMIYKILKDEETVNTIVSNEAFVKSYCEKNGFTYELQKEPEETTEAHTPTLEERTAALEAAMLSMMGVTPNV